MTATLPANLILSLISMIAGPSSFIAITLFTSLSSHFSSHLFHRSSQWSFAYSQPLASFTSILFAYLFKFPLSLSKNVLRSNIIAKEHKPSKPVFANLYCSRKAISKNDWIPHYRRKMIDIIYLHLRGEYRFWEVSSYQSNRLWGLHSHPFYQFEGLVRLKSEPN